MTGFVLQVWGLVPLGYVNSHLFPIKPRVLEVGHITDKVHYDNTCQPDNTIVTGVNCLCVSLCAKSPQQVKR